MEPPIVIEHRDALIYMLTEAAELEHAICCQYLFAGYSLKQRADEGLTDRQLRSVEKWRQMTFEVARQEMLHLATVNNLLSAVGAAPRVARPNLPQAGRHYPASIVLTLLPFGERALRHFLYLERPEGINREDAEGLAALAEAEPLMSEEDIVPRPQDFSTVGHLYRSIEQGLRHLVDRHGEKWLFIGPPRAQATAEHFYWPDLKTVTDLESALAAIDIIVEQGEGTRGHWRDAHYGRFLEILGDYLTMRREDPTFEPARPVLPASVRRPADADPTVYVSDPTTAKVLDGFNVAYEILLYVLARFWAAGTETDAELTALSDVAVGIMVRILSPLGNAITEMPVGPEFPGTTAGPSFELFYSSGYLLPHSDPAWVLIHERLLELATFLKRCGVQEAAEAAEHLAGTLAKARPGLAKREVKMPDAWLSTFPRGSPR